MIGQRIKALRKKRGITQGQLGKGILSVSYISQIENNQREVPVYLIDELAKRLGVTPEELTGTYNNENRTKLINHLRDALESIYTNHIAECFKLLEKVETELETYLEDEELQIQFRLIKILYLFEIEDIDQIELIKDQLRHYSINNYPILQYRMIRIQGRFQIAKMSFREAIELLEEALNMKFDPADTEAAVETGLIYSHIAHCYSMLHNYQSSFDYYEKCIPIFANLGYWYYLAQSNFNMGNIYFARSNWDLALEEYHKVQKITKDLNANKLLAAVLHNLGLVYFQLNQKEEATEYWQEALEITQPFDQEMDVYTGYNIFYAFYKQEKWESFLATAEQLIHLLSKSHHPIVEARVYRTLGHYFRNVNHHPLYLTYYERSLYLFKKVHLYLEAADVCHFIAEDTDNLNLYQESASLYKEYLDQLKIKHE